MLLLLAFKAVANVENAAAIVIEPDPLVIVILEPAVRLASTGAKPVLPIGI